MENFSCVNQNSYMKTNGWFKFLVLKCVEARAGRFLVLHAGWTLPAAFSSRSLLFLIWWCKQMAKQSRLSNSAYWEGNHLDGMMRKTGLMACCVQTWSFGNDFSPALKVGGWWGTNSFGFWGNTGCGTSAPPTGWLTARDGRWRLGSHQVPHYYQ